jgi:hypothetical protein
MRFRFGPGLENALRVRGLDASRVAALADVAPATVSAAVRGRCLNVQTATRIAKAVAACEVSPNSNNGRLARLSASESRPVAAQPRYSPITPVPRTTAAAAQGHISAHQERIWNRVSALWRAFRRCRQPQYRPP